MMKKEANKASFFAESFILFPHHAEMNEGRGSEYTLIYILVKDYNYNSCIM